MYKKSHFSISVLYFGIMALLLLVGACSSTPQTTDGSDVKEPNDKKAPVYYDFGDILIPHELEMDVSSSFVYHTSGFTAGILTFKSKAELGSMVAFFF